MKIFLRVYKDLGLKACHLWSKNIKEQIIETVNAVCDESSRYMGNKCFFPTFWQKDIHARRINVGNPPKSNGYLVIPMYALSFVWEKEDFGSEHEYYQMCDDAGLPYDFTCQPRINEGYTDDVHIGSYRKGQTEPLTLPGLLFDPEWTGEGEVLADNMFVELKSKRENNDVLS